MLSTLIKGFIIGLSIAAPVGPIGVLCIHRSLKEGNLAGFITGMGAATADAIYGAIAAFGLTMISHFVLKHQFAIQLCGGIFLFYLGLKTFFAKIRKDNIHEKTQHNLFKIYITTFLLTLTNPMTILSFIGIFAGLGLGTSYSEYSHAVSLVIGVFLGSLLWWLILSTGVARIFHHQLSGNAIHRVNQFSGIIILLFGFVAIIQML
jgi:threonine/homoserine/homoserine lactone efflux protein